MSSPLIRPSHLAWPLALALQAASAEPLANRAVMQPAPGLEIGYQHLAPELRTPAPGRIEGSLATPAGTLRTTVRVAPEGERVMQRGDISLELPAPGMPGQMQLRALESGGATATWRGPLGGGAAAETQAEWAPDRTASAVQLRQDLGEGDAAQARLSQSSSDALTGSRWDLELTQHTGQWRWTLGADAAERGYLSPSGAAEPRAGVRVGTQWPVALGTKMEVRYSRQARWDAESATSALMVGTRFALPRRASLQTGVEVDTDARRKASVSVTLPLEAP